MGIKKFFLVTMFLAILDFPSSDTWCVRALKLKFHAGFPINIVKIFLNKLKYIEDFQFY